MSQTPSSVGLLMEGGALRGLFTAGVVDVFLEQEISFPCAVGVSAGACFGCNLKSRQPGRVLRYNLAQCKNPDYCSVRSLLRTGDLFGAELCYRTIPKVLDPFDEAAFDSNPMDFWVVCTDITTGKAIYHKCGHICYDEMEWFRASASMPLAARIVEVGGYRMLDGGIADAIPIRFLLDLGILRSVAILTRPRDYVKEASRLPLSVSPLMRKYPASAP